uniref:NADH dehydrogenase subunit 5 n=1 Tax=Euxiphydria potanini TaxID=1518041 RepID=UPI00226490AB|nr:NADH dehydrogenase subunit 5 [Euxiphydria potanini]UYW35402.1 NADH dehydrogenase subunit 5 [Euxiphydria potanini]
MYYTFLFFFYLFILGLMMIIFSMYFLLKNKLYFLEWEFMNLNSSEMKFILLLDWMSLIFIGVVFLISSMIFMFSQEYMNNDLSLNRFLLILILFVISMMLMIISPNLISILLGWDGLGMVSYCLVAYYQNKSSYNASMLTVLMNRLGDIGLLMIISILMYYGSWNLLFYTKLFDFSLITFFLLLAAMTKSAQIPFSSWLPAAMAAPTPVSALVHSSTLVTAGVYLMIRFSEILMVFHMNYYLMFFSNLTMIMSGVNAMYEYDLKKIIAFSTLSQLGLMMSILSMNFLILSFFHLICHAMFKALLFMCAGIVIHKFKNFQDIRMMSPLVKILPYTFMCFNCANLSLCGVPFLTGFYSKDLIMEIILLNKFNMLNFFLFSFSILLTLLYSLRLFFYLSFNKCKLMNLNFLQDNSIIMNFSMLMLFFFSIIMGSSLSWMVFSFYEIIYMNVILKILIYLILLFSVIIIILFMNLKLNLFLFIKVNFLFLFFSHMWFLSLFNLLIIKYPLYMSLFLSMILALGWNEIYGSENLYNYLKFYFMFSEVFYFNLIKNFFMFLNLLMLIFFFYYMFIII